jgi:bacterioferritin-associated ferredoxin
MYICLCNGVTDKQIRREVENGAHSFEEIQAKLEAATGCGMCKEATIAVINEVLHQQRPHNTNVVELWPQRKHNL